MWAAGIACVIILIKVIEYELIAALILLLMLLIPMVMALIDSTLPPRGRNWQSCFMYGGITLSIIMILAAILVPNFLRASAQGSLTACKSNCKNLGTALEMYSTDNYGRYPLRLEQVTPNYLKVSPTCPVRKKCSYAYLRSEVPDAYTIYCVGKGDPNAATHTVDNYPQYDSIQGLIEP